MDHALNRFRKAAARENRKRLRRRYSVALQREAVDYWRARQREGDRLRAVAAALGVAPWSLCRWKRACAEGERFHAVEIAASRSRSPGAAPLVVVSSDGMRVEGLDLHAAAQLLRLLR